MMLRRIGIAVLLLLCLYGGYRFWLVQDTLTRMSRDTMGAFIGPAKAENIVVEFVDYRCGGCRAFQPTIMEFSRRHPDVKIVFRHYPLYAEPSVREASMALASAAQGKFLAMHEYLMSREQPVDEREIPQIASQLGLDGDRLKKDVKSPDIGMRLLQTLDATDILGIDGAPSFLLNGTLYAPHGPMPDIEHFDAVFSRYRKN